MGTTLLMFAFTLVKYLGWILEAVFKLVFLVALLGLILVVIGLTAEEV